MDHVRSRTLLALFAVYAQAQRCILRIAGEFRRGDKPGKADKSYQTLWPFPTAARLSSFFPEHHAMSDRGATP
ncbi:Uncharacterised protein [Escherichia coli]|nr:Uncharacterised protein [Escherichia coli]